VYDPNTSIARVVAANHEAWSSARLAHGCRARRPSTIVSSTCTSASRACATGPPGGRCTRPTSGSTSNRCASARRCSPARWSTGAGRVSSALPGHDRDTGTRRGVRTTPPGLPRPSAVARSATPPPARMTSNPSAQQVPAGMEGGQTRHAEGGGRTRVLRVRHVSRPVGGDSNRSAQPTWSVTPRPTPPSRGARQVVPRAAHPYGMRVRWLNRQPEIGLCCLQSAGRTPGLAAAGVASSGSRPW
jgi:hypothetical protein